jgi:hypothetical protein
MIRIKRYPFSTTDLEAEINSTAKRCKATAVISVCRDGVGYLVVFETKFKGVM